MMRSLKRIANECQYIFSIDYIMANFPVFSKELAVEILKVVYGIFNDIAEVEFINSMDENIINDFFFSMLKNRLFIVKLIVTLCKLHGEH